MHDVAPNLPDRIGRLLRQHAGPLTSELVRQRARFGLGQLPIARQPNGLARSVCGYCSTGCGLDLHLVDGQGVGVSPAADYPVNSGSACPKGWESLAVLDAPDRATTPLLRNEKGVLEPVEWPRALDEFCRRMRGIQQRHGAESVAFLSTGQMPTEEMALLGSLAKFGMGLIHGDGNTRQCMATAVTAYKESFGFDAPPYTYADFEESDVLVLVGANLCLAHPIMWQRVLRNPHQPEIIVVDPRTTETAMAATQHLALKPKSDLALFYGLARRLIELDGLDLNFIAEHTAGFEEFRAFVEPYSLSAVAAATGLEVASLDHAARTIAAGKRVSFWWTMGVNQSYEGVRVAQSLINLALMTGNIGRPGTGANSITGQCNAMGSRLFSNTTNLLGGRSFDNPAHRQRVAEVLELPQERIPNRPSWAYDQIIEGILSEKIRGLWIVATNTAHSWINQNMLRDVLGRLEFLVVQDMYASTETAQQAHLVLPAAGWGEKEGTFINSERRIGRCRKVRRPPGSALADFSIFRLIAEHWGCGDWFARWTDPAATFQILKRLSAGQPCDITGIRDYQMLDDLGGVQWPCIESKDPPETHRRLFADGCFYHPDGRAKFCFESPREMPEQTTKEFPFLLLTGRGSASQWHTQTRTSKSAVLRQLYPAEIYVEINPRDARAAKIRPNQLVVVASQRGKLKAKAVLTPTVRPGQVFIPMHYAATNQLTLAHFDPYSRQPSYKNCAVQVRPIEKWDV